ncbi:hypothetical protein FHS55_002156 [Angulomicrobium tetraedrale]|uniref:Uncharacterized protein n=1 Tax=Ancylobacter tetraedralis TaxID=217068 RepID=A0A839ZA06_9HYPH|nr:hypothetical protein [Ancylobacter tetraedralis]MBB3771557.1 hypothetical protein [Ancylobacter tetraedralis]
MDSSDPASQQAIVASFFGRHDISVRFAEHLPLFPRLGLALSLGFALRAADYQTHAPGRRNLGRWQVGEMTYPERDWQPAFVTAAQIALRLDEICLRRDPARLPTDRMAVLFLAAERDSIPCDADFLAREGYPAAVIAEYAGEAAALAAAITAAGRAYIRAAAALDRAALDEPASTLTGEAA